MAKKDTFLHNINIHHSSALHISSLIPPWGMAAFAGRPHPRATFTLLCLLVFAAPGLAVLPAAVRSRGVYNVVTTLAQARLTAILREKRPCNYTIGVIGGSFSRGEKSQVDVVWPVQLQRQLREKYPWVNWVVKNGAVGATNPVFGRCAACFIAPHLFLC